MTFGGLVDGRHVTVGEQVTLFLSVLSHHSKVRIVKFNFKRNAQTIHHYVHNVLQVVLKLHNILLAKPTPVGDDCTHSSWKHFKGCLGALDGTLIDLTISEIDKARYRTRKGTLAVNVLVVCDRRMRFIYMLTGWEGSVVDARVLRDALSKDDGFRVPQGNLYLCDNGYPNGEGVLTPYKMGRYHLHESGLMEGVTTDQVLEKLINMNDKGRRGWSIREELVLSEAMKKFIRERWKSENGFKSGYLNLLGTYMKQVILKPEPHINSRITVWNKNYHILFEIMKNIGVGLDSTTKMVEATKEQREAFMKKDHNVRLMRHKSWLLYEDWCEIFGQSRATGEGAESHANADTQPPSYSAALDADYRFDKVVDENQAESQSPSGYAVTGESSDMAKTNPNSTLDIYRKMHGSSVQPDTHMYHFLLKAIAESMILREGEKVHCDALKDGFESLMLVQNALVHLYGACGRAESLRVHSKCLRKCLIRILWLGTL
ncbi:hypothetical protein ACS0TY_017959 [Phlomoides rotata]